MSTLWESLVDMYWHVSTRWAELLLGVIKLCCGVWLLLPTDTFASSPSFAEFARIDELWIGGALAVLGATQTVGSVLAWTRWRLAGAVMAEAIWLYMIFNIARHNPSAFALGMLVPVLLFNVVVFVRVARIPLTRRDRGGRGE